MNMASSSRKVRFEDLYEKKGLLGTGGIGKVIEYVRKKDQKRYAVKILNANTFGTSHEDIEREIFLCKTLNHENIIKLIETFVNVDVYHLVFDIMLGGDMFDDIAGRTSYSELDACHCMAQVFEGVAYLHRKDIIHRDLKPPNLLLSNREKNAVVKIADFGLAIMTDGRSCRYGFSGTPRYCAPEIFYGYPYGTAVDMWSCGVVLYVALFGILPFRGPLSDAIDRILVADFRYPGDDQYETVCDDAKDLLIMLLNVDQETRYTAQDALSHPYIRRRNDVTSRFHRSITIRNMKEFNTEKRLSKSATCFVETGIVPIKQPPKSQSDSAIIGNTATPSDLHLTYYKLMKSNDVLSPITGSTEDISQLTDQEIVTKTSKPSAVGGDEGFVESQQDDEGDQIGSRATEKAESEKKSEYTPYETESEQVCRSTRAPLAEAEKDMN